MEKNWYVVLSCESGNTCHCVDLLTEDDVNGHEGGVYFKCDTFTDAKKLALKLNYCSLKDIQHSIRFVRNQKKSDFN